MAKKDTSSKTVDDGVVAADAEKVEVRDPVENCRVMLFDLYKARVAKAETVQTVRRDGRAIFRDAFIEARCALDVYREMVKKMGDR